MKKYDEVKKTVFATCDIPDGYAGKIAHVGVALIENMVVFVADCGYFRASIPPVLSHDEALYLLNHHPHAKHVKNIKSVQRR